MNNQTNYDISFLIASKRPYTEYASKTVDSITLCVNNYSKPISYEVIVCHPEEVTDSRVKWVKDALCNGGNNAFNTAYSVSSGKYACVMVDDGDLTGNIAGILDVFQSEKMKKRKYKIMTLAGGTSDELTWLDPNPQYKEYLQHIGTDTRGFTSLVAPFPIVDRETVDNLMGGCIFRQDINIMGDMFLGMYLHMVEEPVIQYNAAKINIRNRNVEERQVDPITGIRREKHFTESFVNMYKLLYNYLVTRIYKINGPEVEPYLWVPANFIYETTQNVINFYKGQR